MLLLELHGADVAERGMQAALIVNVVDEPGKLLGDVVEGPHLQLAVQDDATTN